MRITNFVPRFGFLMAATLLAAGASQAGTVIYNTGSAATASIALGVNDDGSLNTYPNITQNADATGLAYKFPDGSFYDATAPGCLCEGWGVSVNDAVSGYANQNFGAAVGLTYGAATGVTGSTVTTTASLSALPGITVVQSYAPSTNAPGALFAVTVTITNTTGADVSDLKYVRVMDWDVPHTESNEFVTIKGVGTTSLLDFSNDNGFSSSDPLATPGFPYDSACENADCTDSGPDDHGAYFRFNFGDLANNASNTFTIFYGAAADEEAAIAAIAAEGIELYSLGQSMDNAGSVANRAPTFIFGFKGVGGAPVECGGPGQPACPPEEVPEPASLLLLGAGLASLRIFRRRYS